MPAAHAAHVKTLFIMQVLPIKAILTRTMPNADVLFAATEGGEGKDAEIALPKEIPVDTNETGDMHVGGFSSNAAPALVVEYIAPSVSYVTPAPVEYFAPAPTVDAAPSSVSSESWMFVPRCTSRLVTVSVTILLRIRPLRRRDLRLVFPSTCSRVLSVAHLCMRVAV